MGQPREEDLTNATDRATMASLGFQRAQRERADYVAALAKVDAAWPAGRAGELRASCDGADGDSGTVHVDLAALLALVKQEPCMKCKTNPRKVVVLCDGCAATSNPTPELEEGKPATVCPWVYGDYAVACRGALSGDVTGALWCTLCGRKAT